MKVKVTMVLPEFGIFKEMPLDSRELRREFLNVLKQDLENTEPYLNDTTVSIKFEKVGEYEPSPGDHFEISNRDSWLTVDWQIFRSWTGKRRINGIFYEGPIYTFLTDEIYVPNNNPKIAE